MHRCSLLRQKLRHTALIYMSRRLSSSIMRKNGKLRSSTAALLVADSTTSSTTLDIRLRKIAGYLNPSSKMHGNPSLSSTPVILLPLSCRIMIASWQVWLLPRPDARPAYARPNGGVMLRLAPFRTLVAASPQPSSALCGFGHIHSAAPVSTGLFRQKGVPDRTAAGSSPLRSDADNGFVDWSHDRGKVVRAQASLVYKACPPPSTFPSSSTCYPSSNPSPPYLCIRRSLSLYIFPSHPLRNKSV